MSNRVRDRVYVCDRCGLVLQKHDDNYLHWINCQKEAQAKVTQAHDH